MTDTTSRVIVHMAASLDGFIARWNGWVDWMEVRDEFPGGATLPPHAVASFLASIDCYVMGSRTYEAALGFEAKGLGWVYGEKPTVVLTSRDLPRSRDSVEFRSGDLGPIIAELRAKYRTIWVAGGSGLVSQLLRRGLADELSYAVLPILIGDGIPFFGIFERDIPLHLLEVKPYASGMVELRYEVRHTADGR